MEFLECEKMAILALKGYNIQLSDENIGTVMHYIMVANHKYNENIGNIYGFRKMYIEFGIKTLNRNKKRRKKEILVDDFGPFLHKFQYTDFNSKIFEEDLKKKLTDTEFYAIISKYRDSKTLKEIGKSLGCTYENARLIINKGLKKLRKVYV